MPLVDKVDRMTPGQILADTNVADFIAELGLGIARAQAKLDRNAVKQLIKMARETPEGMENSGKSLLDLGLVPAFYHFQYADLEVTLNVTMTVDRTTITTVDVGVDVEDLDNYEEREGNTDTITVEIKQAKATRAEAILDLANNTDPAGATVSFGGTDHTIAVPADAPRGGNIGETAQHLADALEALAEVQTAEVGVIPGGGNVTLSSSDVDALSVSGNEATVMDEGATPAVHYAALASASADPVELGWFADQAAIDGGSATRTDTFTLLSGTPSDPTTELDIDGKSDIVVLQELAELVDANVSDYSATFISMRGRLVTHPRPADHTELPAKGGGTRDGYVNATAIDYTPLSVEFALDDTTCKPGVRNNQRALDEAVAFLKANPSWTVRLEGHADINGNSTSKGKAHNMSLSKDRATAVMNELVRRGVDGARLKTQGYGATRQIAIYDNGEDDANDRAKRDWLNRRVEFILVEPSGDDTSDPIMKLQADAGGANRISLEPNDTNLRSLGKVDGHEALDIDGVALTIDAGNGPQTFTEGAEFNKGGTPEASAKALAKAINDAGHPDMSAGTRGATVIVGGSGTVATITLTSSKLGPSGNDTGLKATGALSVRRGFHGGAGSVSPDDGATVDLGGKTLSLVKDPDDALEAKEFRLGTDAAATAANLATAINGLSGFSASAGGAVVTVTGPSGTSVSTSDAKFFDLSDGRIGGPVKMKNVEDKTAVAVHTNISVTDSRKYGLEVTGNSTIKARLVSLPVPVDLLDEVKKYFK